MFNVVKFGVKSYCQKVIIRIKTCITIVAFDYSGLKQATIPEQNMPKVFDMRIPLTGRRQKAGRLTQDANKSKARHAVVRTVRKGLKRFRTVDEHAKCNRLG